MLGKWLVIGRTIAIFLVTFLAINTLHFLFLPVRVVLYDALIDVGIAAIVTGSLCYFGLLPRGAATAEEVALSLVVGVLAGTLYSLTVPTIIDRSLSVYILEKLVQRGGGIRQDAFDQLFKQEYMPEHRLVDIRLTEQLNSGTVTIEGGCVRLTRLGRTIAGLTRAYRTTLLPKRREIMGTYSDDLTDPFRKSVAVVPTACDQR